MTLARQLGIDEVMNDNENVEECGELGGVSVCLNTGVSVCMCIGIGSAGRRAISLANGLHIGCKFPDPYRNPVSRNQSVMDPVGREITQTLLSLLWKK
jgi:hypothetical protein